MNLGKFQLQYGLIQAPLESISNPVFRRIMREHGAEFSWGERTNAEGVVRGCRKNLALFEIGPDEHPIALQVSGGNGDLLAAGAIIAESMGADVVDINMGCPAKSVCANGAGSGMLRDTSLLAAIFEKVVRAVSIPVSVKIRAGWDHASINAPEVAHIAQESGIAWVGVHPRTRMQGYHGPSNWDIIAAVKAAVRFPVVGNGDLNSAEDIARMYAYTGCDAVMVARGMLGNPWIFRDYRRLADGLEPLPPTQDEVRDTLVGHLDAMIEYAGPEQGLFQMRKHISWYVKGIRNAAVFRDRMMRCADPAEVRESILAFFEEPLERTNEPVVESASESATV